MRDVSSLLIVATLALPDIAAGDVKSVTERTKSGVFDATGEVRCAQEAGQELGRCEASSARDGGSAAAVVVTFPNGFARTLMFENGAFLRGNATMSGVGTDTDWRLSDGLYEVRVDDQRFEIPEALVLD